MASLPYLEKTMDNISISEYALRLFYLDWYGDFSDDYRVASKASAERQYLRQIAQYLGGDYLALWIAQLNRHQML